MIKKKIICLRKRQKEAGETAGNVCEKGGERNEEGKKRLKR
jgi:hypothetical protein